MTKPNLNDSFPDFQSGHEMAVNQTYILAFVYTSQFWKQLCSLTS
jgi:hypothetical protein